MPRESACTCRIPEWASRLSPCELEASFKNISAPFSPVPVLPENAYNVNRPANSIVAHKNAKQIGSFRIQVSDAKLCTLLSAAYLCARNVSVALGERKGSIEMITCQLCSASPSIFVWDNYMSRSNGFITMEMHYL